MSPEDEKAHLVHATVRLFRMGAKWTAESQDNERRPNRAVLVAGEHVFVVAPNGTVAVHHAADGRRLHDLKLGLPVWDGLGAAGGRLYVSMDDGRLLCLGVR